MPLAIGDNLAFAGRNGQVVGVTATTNADGRGSIAYDGKTFQFRLLKASPDGATEFPLVATNDAYMRVGLVLQDDSDPALYCLCFDDLPAPGWGRWVQGVSSPSRWGEASEFALQDSVVFTLGWRPGTITIKRTGVAQVGAFADIVLSYSTSDGTHTTWWQPAYPSKAGTTWGAAKGRFYTDANGVLWACAPNGTLSHIIFPKAFGALGQRAGDVWVSSPTPERVLTKAEVFYLQMHAEISEGAGVTLNVAAVNITINGPASANYIGWWEEGLVRIDGTLDGAGTATRSGLPAGTYTFTLYKLLQQTWGLPKQEVECLVSGDYTISFPGSWTEAPTGQVQGVCYRYGVTGLPNSLVRCRLKDYMANGEWMDLATTDGSGAFGPVTPPTLMSNGNTGIMDALSVSDAYGASVDVIGLCFWITTLAARWGASVEANAGIDPSAQPDRVEGLTPWGIAGEHLHLLPGTKAAYIKHTASTDRYDIQPSSAGNGMISEPLPAATREEYWTADPTPWLDLREVARLYSVYEQDGTLLQWGLPPQDSFGMHVNWTNGTERDVPIGGNTVGGKIDGNLVEASRSSLITTANLREAARMGLETGRWTIPMEARHYSATLATARALTFQAWECPFCGGPAWTGPNAGGYLRGYCVACMDNGRTVDCRTYFLPQTLATFADWSTRAVKNTTAGWHVDRLVTGWPRPAEYYETDAYLVDPWVDGLPRWVAVHIVLGTLAGGTFTDGESIAQAEARLSQTIGPVMLKLVLTAGYSGTGKVVLVTATRADGSGSAVLTATVPGGASSDDIVLLDYAAHDTYPHTPCKWYTDVTAASEVSGDGTLSCQIVNDGPSWRSSAGCIVSHWAYSPWACDVLFAEAGLCCFHQIPNFLYVFYARGDEAGLKHVYSSPPSQWFDDGISRAHYPLPRTDTSEADSSPSGYVDKNGIARVYFVRTGSLLRLDSQNWCLSWGSPVTTAITSAEQAFVKPSNDGMRQHCVYVNGGTFAYAHSHDHLATVDGESTIATGVDSAQVCCYEDGNAAVNAFAFVGGALNHWKMSANGVWV